MRGRCVIKRPGLPAEIGEIDIGLKPLQVAVGGYIEAIPLEPGVILFCNEEGRLRGLRPNVQVGPVLVGTVVVLGHDADAADEVPLTIEQAERWRAELDRRAVRRA